LIVTPPDEGAAGELAGFGVAVGEGVAAGVGVAVGEGVAGEGEAAGADSLVGGAETPDVDEALPVQAEATPTMTSGTRSRASDERLVHV
jgi:hypothetical protein